MSHKESSNLKTSRRRTFSLESSLDSNRLPFPKCEDNNTLKKSFSSSIKIPSGLPIQNCADDESLEDLNKEIEKLCPFHSDTTDVMLPHQLKLANSRYYDISIDLFSNRQSMESDDNSSPDDERIKFLSTIPKQSGCEVIQLIPKKPDVIISEQTLHYQPPCTNSTIQLKQSSFSAFRDISEIKLAKQQSDDADDGKAEQDGGNGCEASSSHIFP